MQKVCSHKGHPVLNNAHKSLDGQGSALDLLHKLQHFSDPLVGGESLAAPP